MGEELTVEVDPIASMRCWAIEIELGGRTYEVPALPAVDWWPVLATGELTRILDFIVSTPDDPFNLDDLLLEEDLTTGELTTVLTDVVEAATGRSLHVALCLAAVATRAWSNIGGQLAQRGFRWDVQPIGAALDAVYPAIMGAIEKKEDREKFVRFMENETLTTGKRRRPDHEKSATEFETLAGPKPIAGLTATGAPSDSARPRTRQQRRQLRPAAL